MFWLLWFLLLFLLSFSLLPVRATAAAAAASDATGGRVPGDEIAGQPFSLQGRVCDHREGTVLRLAKPLARVVLAGKNDESHSLPSIHRTNSATRPLFGNEEGVCVVHVAEPAYSIVSTLRS